MFKNIGLPVFFHFEYSSEFPLLAKMQKVIVTVFPVRRTAYYPNGQVKNIITISPSGYCISGRSYNKSGTLVSRVVSGNGQIFAYNDDGNLNTIQVVNNGSVIIKIGFYNNGGIKYFLQGLSNETINSCYLKFDESCNLVFYNTYDHGKLLIRKAFDKPTQTSKPK